MLATKPLNFRLRQTQKLRAEVFSRDNFTCQICGWRPVHIPSNYDGRYTLFEKTIEGTLLSLELDHINPRVNDGQHIVENLQTLCNRCNAGKGSR